MSGYTASWRIALRSGRRDALRSKGRSALIAVMVGTPVMLTVVLSSVLASNEISATEGLVDRMGAAPAVAQYGHEGLYQSPDGSSYGWTGSEDELSVEQQRTTLASVASARLVRVDQGYANTIVIDGRGYRTDVLGLDAAEPATTGMFAVDQGRAPRADDEVLVTQALADRGASIGSTVTLGSDVSLEVVGIGTTGTVVRGGQPRAVLVMPGVVEVTEPTTYLLDRAEPVTWSDVRDLNAAGFLVISRQVLADPPPASEQYRPDELGSASDDGTRAVLAIAVTAIVLQVVLLAGPAFAVGVRRQRRDLALLAATGASPAHIRRVVLGQALVLGVLSCLVGAASGIALAALIVRFGPSLMPAIAFGPFEVRWMPIVVAIVLGSVAALLAALVPARQAAKQEVAAVLAGRRGTVRTSRGWPAVGAAMIVAGLVGCFTLGTRQGGEIAVASSTVAIVMGTVLLTPAAIGLLSRAGGVLPLPLRLAVRDTARQRSRSAPAIAAVMASVAGITTLAIASASDFEQGRREYQYQSAPGRMIITADADHLAEAQDLATRTTGGVRFTAMGSGDEGDGESYVYVTAGPSGQYSTLYVADAQALAVWGVALTAQQATALDAGSILVDRRDVGSGRNATLSVETGEKTRTVDLPVVAADLGLGSAPDGAAPRLYGSVVSPETAAAHDLPWSATRAISEPGAPAFSESLERQVGAAVRGLVPEGGSASVERGFEETFTLATLALAGVGSIAVLVATMTATGLALSDARPDFSTLAAVGAAPRTRRLVAGGQAIVLASIGTALGVAVGFAPGIAATWPLTTDSYSPDGTASSAGPVVDIPWSLLAILLVVVPLIAALAATVFARSRLQVVRRLAQ